MSRVLAAMMLSPVLVAGPMTIPQPAPVDPMVIYQMREQLTDLRQQLATSVLTMDEVVLDDIQQEHLRGMRDRWRYMTPLRCLTDNIYYEAANEPYDGKVAVAQVTMNRVADDFGGDTVCQVVYFKTIDPANGKKQAAFSWTLGSKWRPKHISRDIYQHCQQIAKAVLDGQLKSTEIGPDVEYYHAAYIHPDWASDHQFVIQIGQHLFYRE